MSKKAQTWVTFLLIGIIAILLVCAILIPSGKYLDELYDLHLFGASNCLALISCFFAITIMLVAVFAMFYMYAVIHQDDEDKEEDEEGNE